MVTSDVYFALVAYWGYHDWRDEWQDYDSIAGIFLKPSQALEAARNVAPCNPGFDCSDIDSWNYTPYETLIDGIEVNEEHQSRIHVLEWEIVPVVLGSIDARYSDIEKANVNGQSG